MHSKGKRMAAILACLVSAGIFPGSAGEARPVSDGSRTEVITDITKTAIHKDQRRVSAEEILDSWEQRHRDERRRSGMNMESPRRMSLWKTRTVDGGGTLLFSDSPEYVEEDGILYADTVSGEARILYYHLNQTNEPKKVAVVIENESGRLNAVNVTRGAMGDPSTDYLQVGKSTQMDYFDDARSRIRESIYLLKDSKRLLQERMDWTVLNPGELVYGVYDFRAAHPVKVSVIMYPAGEDPIAFLRRAKVLPKDEHRLRGTFHGMNRTIQGLRTYDPGRDGIVYFPIGDDQRDRYRTGIDATDGSPVTNQGNYGVLYKIQLPMQGAATCFLSPLGGVYAGAMSVSRNGASPNLLPTPRGRTFFGDKTPPDPAYEAGERGEMVLAEYAELADLGTYRGTSRLLFEYSPPGASNLPVNIILMPEDQQ